MSERQATLWAGEWREDSCRFRITISVGVVRRERQRPEKPKGRTPAPAEPSTNGGGFDDTERLRTKLAEAMADVNAHEAAVRAVAKGECSFVGAGPCSPIYPGLVVHPRCALAALTTDPDVRATLVEEIEDAVSGGAPGLAGESDEWRDFFHDGAIASADAILTALAPPEA